MNISLHKTDLFKLFIYQVNNHFPDSSDVKGDKVITKSFDHALQRVEYCFSKINNKYYSNNGIATFNHLNGDHNAVLLYYFSNTLYNNSCDQKLCEKFFYLNKILHGLDAFYEVVLPDIFQLVHPLGTVLGRGHYSNYFIAYQRCGIGSNKDVFPVMGEHLTLRPGSSILGNCRIGDNCEMAAGSLLLDSDLSDNTLYIGNPKSKTIISSKRENKNWLF